MEKTQIEIGKAVGYGWQSLKKDFWYFVGISLTVGVISGISSREPGRASWGLIGFLLSILMTCGYTKMVLSYRDGKKLAFTELFTQFTNYWRVLGASLLVGVIIAVGFALLIVPGIYFALRFQFTITSIIDGNLGVFAAMKRSTELTRGVKLPLLGFDLTMFGVIILGVLALGFGVLIAIPITWLANIDVYRKLATTVKS